MNKLKKSPLTISETLKLSRQLYALHKHEWKELTPESNIYFVGWLVAEIGEVLDVIKKKGVDKIMNDPSTRNEMLEEISDCYMYLADILNRYQYTAEEFGDAYRKKMNHNLKRDYSKSQTRKDKRK